MGVVGGGGGFSGCEARAGGTIHRFFRFRFFFYFFVRLETWRRANHGGMQTHSVRACRLDADKRSDEYIIELYFFSQKKIVHSHCGCVYVCLCARVDCAMSMVFLR